MAVQVGTEGDLGSNAAQLVTERWSISGISEATRSYATPLARCIRVDDTPLGVANVVRRMPSSAAFTGTDCVKTLITFWSKYLLLMID